MEFIDEILATFLETSVDLVQAIDSAGLTGDADKATYAAHTLKGSLRSIGAEPLAALCQDLEQFASSGDMASFAELASQVPAGFNKLRLDIEAMTRDRAA